MNLTELLKTRRTYRKFDQTRPVPDQTVQAILEAQQLASCANNRQPLRYIVIRTPEMVEKTFSLTRWAAALPPEIGMPRDGEHPTLFIAVLKDKAIANAWTDVDVGLAVSNMTLAAWEQGVGSCILANIQREPLRELLGIGDGYDLHLLLAFGYPTHTSEIKEVEKDAPLAYSTDENYHYTVPRRKISDVVLAEK